MKIKKNSWDKIPFENIIKTIVDKQGRDNYDAHKISRKENKNFFSIHWYDEYDNEVVVLTKSGRKTLKRAIQPFLAEKIKFVDIDHDEHGNIDAIKILTNNHTYAYSPRGKDGEIISINRWFELYRYAKRYNLKLFLKEILSGKEELSLLSGKEELSLGGFKLKHIIPENNNNYILVFQDQTYPKDDWDEDSFLYLHLNSEGKIMKRPQGENSLLIKLS